MITASPTTTAREPDTGGASPERLPSRPATPPPARRRHLRRAAAAQAAWLADLR